MKAGRTGFNPCLFNGRVYVCRRGSKLVEAFSPQTNNFIPLHFQLSEPEYCCLFVLNSLLVVHSTNYISKFTAGQAGQLIKHSKVRATPVGKYSNAQPVVNPTRGLFYLCKGTRL